MVKRRNVAGIWRLTASSPPPLSSQDAALLLQKQATSLNSTYSDSTHAILVLNADGSFKMIQQDTERQSKNIMMNDEIVKARFQSGTWDVREKKLILAGDRISSIEGATLPDNILVGEVQGTFVSPQLENENNEEAPSSQAKNVQQYDYHLSVPVVKLCIGKFMYPKHHPAFFDLPILAPLTDSPTTMEKTFELHQLVSSSPTTDMISQSGKASLKNGSTNNDNPIFEKYKQVDFYNKTFLMTVVPVEPKSKQKKNKKQLKFSANKGGDSLAPFDLQVLPIHFFSNNTFCAKGNNKILRGRFHIRTRDEDCELFFQVSLFGFGRSVSGSVYRYVINVTLLFLKKHSGLNS